MTSDKNLEKQKNFLGKIKYLLPSTISYADALAEILQLSPDSVYRRIRGETSLTFDELVKLCHHYKLSFDSLIECDAAAVTFNYNQITPEIESFKDYLRSILEDLVMLNKAGNGNVIYIADDIPIFHLFVYPELASFKMYYWMKSVLNVPEYQNEKYSFDTCDSEILEIGEKIREAYAYVPSIEIWTEYTVNSLRKQIEYYYEAGFFEDNRDALKICDQAAELIRHVSNLADKSTKLPDSRLKNFTLYYSEIEIGNNCILVSVNHIKKVYLTYNTFNKMSTGNEKFCNETKSWINYLIAKSNLISGVSEKQRFQFVNKILEQLESTREKITGH
jgi:hypothetical protein